MAVPVSYKRRMKKSDADPVTNSSSHGKQGIDVWVSVARWNPPIKHGCVIVIDNVVGTIQGITTWLCYKHVLALKNLPA